MSRTTRVAPSARAASSAAHEQRRAAPAPCPLVQEHPGQFGGGGVQDPYARGAHRLTGVPRDQENAAGRYEFGAGLRGDLPLQLAGFGVPSFVQLVPAVADLRVVRAPKGGGDGGVVRFRGNGPVHDRHCREGARAGRKRVFPPREDGRRPAAV